MAPQPKTLEAPASKGSPQVKPSSPGWFQAISTLKAVQQIQRNFRHQKATKAAITVQRQWRRRQGRVKRIVQSFEKKTAEQRLLQQELLDWKDHVESLQQRNSENRSKIEKLLLEPQNNDQTSGFLSLQQFDVRSITSGETRGYRTAAMNEIGSGYWANPWETVSPGSPDEYTSMMGEPTEEDVEIAPKSLINALEQYKSLKPAGETSQNGLAFKAVSIEDIYGPSSPRSNSPQNTELSSQVDQSISSRIKDLIFCQKHTTIDKDFNEGDTKDARHRRCVSGARNRSLFGMNHENRRCASAPKLRPNKADEDSQSRAARRNRSQNNSPNQLLDSSKRRNRCTSENNMNGGTISKRSASAQSQRPKLAGTHFYSTISRTAYLNAHQPQTEYHPSYNFEELDEPCLNVRRQRLISPINQKAQVKDRNTQEKGESCSVFNKRNGQPSWTRARSEEPAKQRPMPILVFDEGVQYSKVPQSFENSPITTTHTKSSRPTLLLDGGPKHSKVPHSFGNSPIKTTHRKQFSQQHRSASVTFQRRRASSRTFRQRHATSSPIRSRPPSKSSPMTPHPASCEAVRSRFGFSPSPQGSPRGTPRTSSPRRSRSSCGYLPNKSSRSTSRDSGSKESVGSHMHRSRFGFSPTSPQGSPRVSPRGSPRGTPRECSPQRSRSRFGYLPSNSSRSTSRGSSMGSRRSSNKGPAVARMHREKCRQSSSHKKMDFPVSEQFSVPCKVSSGGNGDMNRNDDKTETYRPWKSDREMHSNNFSVEQKCKYKGCTRNVALSSKKGGNCHKKILYCAVHNRLKSIVDNVAQKNSKLCQSPFSKNDFDTKPESLPRHKSESHMLTSRRKVGKRTPHSSSLRSTKEEDVGLRLASMLQKLVNVGEEIRYKMKEDDNDRINCETQSDREVAPSSTMAERHNC